MTGTIGYKIKIIGLGGIGAVLGNQLARFINFSEDHSAEFLLIDGDIYEPKNYQRQEFFDIGPKADVKCSELRARFTRSKFDSFTEYLNVDNVGEVIEEGDIVLMCVDNHKTRKIISDHVSTLKDVTLISGGNEYTDGNVQIHKRQGGKNLTPSLTDYHPEIETPDDRSPEEMSCEELAKSEPQLLFTNLSVAALMCQAFYTSIIKQENKYSEVYFDMLSMKADSKTRSPLNP